MLTLKVYINTFEDISGTAGAIGVVLLRENAPAYNITIKNNVIRHCSRGISFAIKTKNTLKRVVIRDNYFSEDTPPFAFVGNGNSEDWFIGKNDYGKPYVLDNTGNINVGNLKIKK